MNESIKNIAIIALLIIVGYLLFLNKKNSTNNVTLKSTEMIIQKSAWDSIKKISEMKPEIIRDTVYIKGPVRIITKEVPVPIEIKDSIKTFKDSVKNESIDVSYTYKIKGSLLSTQWEYTPITREVTEIRKEYIPKIVDNIVNVPVPKNGLYLNGIMGGNMNSFLFGAGLDFITKKDRQFGYQYQRFGSSGFHLIKLGIKIF